MTPDTYGPTWRVPLAHYDPDSSCWKTSQGMFPLDWPTLSETCPRWGMTRRGELFELPIPALPTVEPASSSLPTPQALDYKDETLRPTRHRPGSTDSVPRAIFSLLPTPRTSDTNGAGDHGQGGPDLRTAVTLLPTPAVNDMGASYTVETWDEWTAKMQAAHGNGNGHGKSLSIEALRLSSGAPTDQPSTDGPQSWDAPLLLPPSPDATDRDSHPDSLNG